MTYPSMEVKHLATPPSATDFKKVQPLPYRQGGDTHYGYIVVQGKTVPLSTLP